MLTLRRTVALHETLLQAGAANTFLQSDTSSCGVTWWSAIPGARPRRIDFVAVPESWLPCVTSAGAEPNIDIHASRLDHTAVVVPLRFSVLTGEAPAPCFRRPQICDSTLLNDPIRVPFSFRSSRTNWTLIPIISS